MSHRRLFLAIGFALLWCSAVSAKQAPIEWFTWSSLPDLPEPLGVAGAFVGRVDDTLIVADGSNFPSPLANGGQKTYHDGIFALRPSSSDTTGWKRAGRLPMKMAHGAAVSIPNGLICLGGRTDSGPSSAVFFLPWDPVKGTFGQSKTLPALPVACDFLAAAFFDDRVYVAGGRNASGRTMHNFWVLALPPKGNFDALQGWKQLPAWSGPARSGAVLTVQNDGEYDRLYLFGGRSDDAYLSDG